MKLKKTGDRAKPFRQLIVIDDGMAALDEFGRVWAFAPEDSNDDGLMGWIRLPNDELEIVEE